jgi:hypothetical protein
MDMIEKKIKKEEGYMSFIPKPPYFKGKKRSLI